LHGLFETQFHPLVDVFARPQVQALEAQVGDQCVELAPAEHRGVIEAGDKVDACEGLLGGVARFHQPLERGRVLRVGASGQLANQQITQAIAENLLRLCGSVSRLPGAGGFRHGRRNGYQRRAGEFCVDQAAWKRVHTVGVGQSSGPPETATLRMWRCVQDGSDP